MNFYHLYLKLSSDEYDDGICELQWSMVFTPVDLDWWSELFQAALQIFSLRSSLAINMQEIHPIHSLSSASIIGHLCGHYVWTSTVPRFTAIFRDCAERNHFYIFLEIV